MNYLNCRIFLAVAGAIFLLFPGYSGGGAAESGGISMPVSTQFELFRKILKFDRNLKTRAGNAVAVGVLFQSSFRLSQVVKEQAIAALSDKNYTIEGIKVTPQEIDASKITDLEKELRTRNITLLYIAPTQAFRLDELLRITRSLKVLTLTGVPEYVAAGVSVGLGTEQDDRPKILINRTSAALEGADFQAYLLKLAKIYE